MEPDTPPQPPKIKRKHSYQTVMTGISCPQDIRVYLTEDALRAHKIRWQKRKPSQTVKPPTITILSLCHLSMIANYRVEIGQFEVDISLINVPAPINQKEPQYGRGSYGKILKGSLRGKPFYAKVQPMMNSSAIRRVVMELAITKICSILEIGPATKTDLRFDLIAYTNGIQFQLEICTLVTFKQQLQFNKKYAEDILSCLFTLHSVGIVHRDFKLQNTLWCERLKKYVLCDFGLSEYIVESIGERSPIGLVVGTFPSREVREANKFDGFADLYGCDLLALRDNLMKIGEKEYYQRLNQYYVEERPEAETTQERDRDARQKVSSESWNKTSSSSGEHSEPESRSVAEQQLVSSWRMLIDRYDFFNVLYAAVSINDHDLNLRNNFRNLNLEEVTLITNITNTCYSKRKFTKILNQIMELRLSGMGDWNSEEKADFESFAKSIELTSKRNEDFKFIQKRSVAMSEATFRNYRRILRLNQEQLKILERSRETESVYKTEFQRLLRLKVYTKPENPESELLNNMFRVESAGVYRQIAQRVRKVELPYNFKKRFLAQMEANLCNSKDEERRLKEFLEKAPQQLIAERDIISNSLDSNIFVVAETRRKSTEVSIARNIYRTVFDKLKGKQNYACERILLKMLAIQEYGVNKPEMAEESDSQLENVINEDYERDLNHLLIGPLPEDSPSFVLDLLVKILRNENHLKLGSQKKEWVQLYFEWLRHYDGLLNVEEEEEMANEYSKLSGSSISPDKSQERYFKDL